MKHKNIIMSLRAKRGNPVFALIGLAIILVLGPLVYFRLLRPGKSFAGWFNDSWAFRKAVNITNSSGGALTDFQVSVGVGTSALISAGKMQSNCNDIRITDQNGKLIPYWIEEGANGCNQVADTTVWTKVPSVPSTGGTVYVYYGNPSASATADGNKVFEFFDNFSGTSVDRNKWSVGTGFLSPSISGGTASIGGGSSSPFISKNPVTDSSGLGRLIFRSKQSVTNLTGGLIGFSSTNSPTSTFASGESAYLGLGTMEEKLNDFGATNLMAQYKLDETTFPEPNQFKASGYLDTGKLSQAVSIYGNSAGTNGSTLTFNSGAQISGNNYEHINTNQGTVSFWFKPSWNGTDGAEHTFYYQTFNGGYLLIGKSVNNNQLFVYVWTGTLYSSNITTTITSGNWYHVVVRWDADNVISGSNRLEISANGVAGTGGGTSNMSVNVPGTTGYIGSFSNISKFSNSLIDDFAIYDRVLTSAEITALYGGGTAPVEAGSVADPSLKFYAKMDGTGTLSPVTYNGGASASKMTSKSTELAGGTNLLANGLFESASAGIGTSWSKYNGSETTADAETASILADTRSQKITPPDSTADYGIKQNVTVTASTNYALTGWLKSDGSHTASIVLYDTTNSLDITTTAQLGTGTTANVWTRINYAFKTNAGQTALDVRVLTPTGQGAVFYVDNVSVTPNLVDNGGMEGWTGGVLNTWGAGVRGTNNQETGAGNFHSGTSSNKFIIASGQTNGYFQSPLTNITIDNWYLVSAWIKNGNATSVQLNVFSSTGATIATVTGTSASWTKYSVIVKATTATFGVEFKILGAADQYAYIDDVSLIPLDNTALSFQSWTPVDDSSPTAQNDLSIHGSSVGVGTTIGVLNNAYKFDGSTGYLRQKTYDMNVGTLTYVAGSNDTTTAEFSDTGQNFSDYNSVGGTAPYMIVVTNSDNTTSWGYCGTANGSNLHMDIYTTKGLSARGWNGTAPVAGGKTPVGYEVRKTDFQITGAVTVGAWVKTGASVQTGARIISKGDQASSDSYDIDVQANGFRFVTYSGTYYVSSSSAPSPNTWYYLVGVKDTSSNKQYLYVNGDLVDTDDTTGTSVESSYPLLISAAVNSGSVTFFNNALIDSPFVISSALTADQIKALYNYYTVTSSHTGTKTTPANTASGVNDVNYHIYSLSSQLSQSLLTQDGTTLTTSTTNLPTSSQYLRIQNSDPTNNLTLDWVAVTKQASAFPTAALSATEEQAKSPVAYWPMDEGQGTIINDSSSNRNNGTLGVGTSSPTWVTEDMCISGKCLKFDGNDFVSIGSTAKNVQTISFWVKPTTTTQNFIDLDNGTHYISATSGVVSATGFGTPSIYVNGVLNGTFTANQWAYVEVTTATSFNATSIKLGQRSTNFLTGFLDEVKLFAYARTAAEIKADFNARGTNKGVGAGVKSKSAQIGQISDPLANGLVGYWKMDENTGTTTTDSSGNSNTGTFGTGSSAPSWSTGMFGVGLSFDGAGDYVGITHNQGNNIKTVSVWFKLNSMPTGTPGGIVLANAGSTSGPAGWDKLLRVTTSGKIEYYFHDGSARNATGTTTLTTGVWYHAVGVTENNKTVVYLNGKAEGLYNSVSTYSGNNMIIDFDDTVYNLTQDINGSLDEIRIYNRALSPAEVRNLYNWAPGPKVYLKTDEGVGSSAFDSSGYSNNGLLNGGTWNTGKYGKGVRLNGTTDNVSVGDFGY